MFREYRTNTKSHTRPPKVGAQGSEINLEHTKPP